MGLSFGPKAPKGFEKNRIPTVPGKGWFAWCGLYAPTEPYFEKRWSLRAPARPRFAQGPLSG